MTFAPLDREYFEIVGSPLGHGIDARTMMFMDLVECEEWEVRDIPPARIGVAPTFVSEEQRQGGLATTEISFGKHSGKQLRHVPRSYLEWLASTPPNRKYKKSEKLKQKVREFLATQ